MERPSNREAQPAVVVLDDDAALLSSLEFALEMEGYSIKAYHSTEDLLAEVDPPNTGCLILDYNLPGTNGLDVLQTLRAMGVAAPAIIITTEPGATLRRRSEAQGVAIVEKPLLGNALLDAIRVHLIGWSR